MALTVFFVLYIAAELPAAWLVKHVGPDILLPVMCTLWGLTSASQGFVTNYSGLLICRVFLGLAEGGIVPVLTLYVSFFYPRDMLQTRIGAFYALASLAGAFTGLLSAAIENMGGVSNRPGWAWIFIIDGIISIAFGLAAFFLLPRSPARARFLTEKERAYVISTLKRAGSVSEDGIKDNFRWVEVVRAAKSPHLWMVGVASFLSGTTVFGMGFFEPSIVASLGYSGNEAQLMSVPPYAITFVFCVISAVISDRYHCRGYNAIFFALLQTVGFAMFYGTLETPIDKFNVIV
ncbi:major facilitator superfamily domain-containing protein [Chiua virens]|nr:major facilitator superfamily domain-containing protein [Chiua virens]